MLGSKSTALIIPQTWWFLYESREFKSCNPSLLAAEVLGRSRPRSESVDFLRRISPVLLQVHGINRSWGYQPDQPHQKWLPNNGWLINPYSCGCPWLLVVNTLFRSRSIIWGVTSVLSWGTGWCELGLFFLDRNMVPDPGTGLGVKMSLDNRYYILLAMTIQSL
jgi:hypothetical protein